MKISSYPDIEDFSRWPAEIDWPLMGVLAVMVIWCIYIRMKDGK